MYMCSSLVEYPEALKSASDKEDPFYFKKQTNCIFNNEHWFLARMQSCANTEFLFLFLLVYNSSGMNLYALHLLVSLPSQKETNIDIFVPP